VIATREPLGGSGATVPRLIVGGWQMADGHSGIADRQAIFTVWDALLDRGFDTFDCADIYTGVEALLGEFGRRRGRPFRVHTKLVPDRDRLATLTRPDVARIVDRSLRRLGRDRLDLVQLHWWDYSVPGMEEALGWLDELRRAGKIADLGVTNCDVLHLDRLVATGVPVASIQLQYSALDHRPERGMAAYCADRGIALLCYGTLAGGFLSDRWLDRPDPGTAPENRSLVKYRLVIEELGGWEAFQALLRALAEVGRRDTTSVAAVALAYVLAKPGVAAAIVGVRSADHLARWGEALELTLTADDLATIAAVTGPGHGPDGDVYELERMPGGPHAAIMKYDLNARATD
jgi:aryl-alcohol dehydrogenase-like predicted oxidoreductase